MRTKNISQIPDINLPTPAKRDPFNHLRNRIHYLTQLKHIVDGYQAKQFHIDAMKRNIQNQKMLNYQREYDRIVQALEHAPSPGMSRDQLKKRRKHLEALGIKAVSVMPN